MEKHLRVLGSDIAKQIFHVVGMDDAGNVVLRKRLPRGALMSFIAQMPPVMIGMEACGGAHYWARRFREHGHTVKLMAPQFVKPYVKSNKHDMADAEAIGEAVTRPTMRFVPIKEVAQQDLQALHRIRERLVKARTALINEIRGLLSEYGIVLPQGVTKFRHGLLHMLEQEQAKLTALGREIFRQLYEEWLTLEKQLTYYNEQLDTMCQAHPVCQRLRTIPGIGPLTATALVAAVTDATHFKNGRQLAAWLGLVPRQHSTGGKPHLLGISKRGDRYLRKLLVHGARATLRWIKLKSDRRSQWVRALIERRGTNRTVVALANKNARIAWVLLTTDQVYRPEHATA
ncbi:MAG: IS110 family transposase [Candidatus Tectomicrobia bacterium]|nr:IS110 family transposase [Candidatus Tectomicrobia bacterium]